jgi:hypothetical protein
MFFPIGMAAENSALFPAVVELRRGSPGVHPTPVAKASGDWRTAGRGGGPSVLGGREASWTARVCDPQLVRLQSALLKFPKPFQLIWFVPQADAFATDIVHRLDDVEEVLEDFVAMSS